MHDRDQREGESRESPETKYDEAQANESEERDEIAARIPQPPPPKEENEGD
jgi:hypothetical protein